VKDLIDQALAMISDRPKEEVEFMHYVLTMEDDLKYAFLIAYQIAKERNESKQDTD